MTNSRVTRLTALRNELAEIKEPNYPNAFWPLVNSWIAKATPTIRRDWNEHLGDFQKIAVEPNNSRIVYHNSDFSLNEQEHRRQWELDNLETDEVRQIILEFLNGLLILPENPTSPKKKTPAKNKTKSPVEVLIAKYGLFGTLAVAIFGVISTCITAYFGYMSIRAQIEAPILATQTAEAKLASLTSIVNTAIPPVTLTPLSALMPTMTPTSAPYASVKVFSVMRDGRVIDTVKPNETTNKMVVGSKVDIRAEVSSNIALTDLKFTWYTCQNGDHIWEWGDGVFVVSYEVPNIAADCIRVKIEKGGTLLFNNIIHVNIQR